MTLLHAPSHLTQYKMKLILGIFAKPCNYLFVFRNKL